MPCGSSLDASGVEALRRLFLPPASAAAVAGVGWTPRGVAGAVERGRVGVGRGPADPLPLSEASFRLGSGVLVQEFHSGCALGTLGLVWRAAEAAVGADRRELPRGFRTVSVVVRVLRPAVAVAPTLARVVSGVRSTALG